MRTAASIEIVAIHFYDAVLALPVAVSGASIPLLQHVLTTNRAHHAAHVTTLNAAAHALGGADESGLDGPLQAAVVTPALAALNGPADVLRAAVAMEDTLAATYASYAGSVSDSGALGAFAATAPIEAQHGAVLLTLQQLLAAGAPELLASPPDTQALPAGAGTAGFPASSLPLSAARPIGEESR